MIVHVQNVRSFSICLPVPGIPGTPGTTGQPPAGEGGSNVVRKRQKTSSDPESDASESEFNSSTSIECSKLFNKLLGCSFETSAEYSVQL